MMLRPTLSAMLVGLAVAGTGCGNPDQDCGMFCSGGTGSGPGTTMSGTGDTDTDTATSSMGTGTDTPTTATTASTQTDPSSDTDPGTDTEAGSDTDATGSTGGEPIVPCIGVNFVFVVDNSIGMAPEQSRFQATAFALVSQVAQQTLSAMGNVSIAVITTDEPEFVVPTGIDAVPYSSGLNYMRWDPLSVDNNLTLQNELSAAVLTGEDGDPNERPMDMLLEALTGDTADGFNADFVEEDALLVVVLVSDEEDDIEQPTLWGSDGEPDAWVDQLVTLKDGIRKDIAVFSVVPDMSAAGCADDTDATRLKAFTSAFQTSASHDVCQMDYSAFLLAQVQPLVDACNSFSPP
ncbi:MAG: hypothetical protein KUG77_08685 [Nannocystaceae bacterium]|nr:hypothetical protein [Nannocystaceae bacterium]